MRDRIRQQQLLGLERDRLGGIVEAGGHDLLDLVPEEVELAGAGPGVAAESLELDVDGATRGARLAVRREGVERDGARVAVERGALHGGVEQRLVCVLSVQVDQVAAELGELARGRQPPVDVGTAAALTRDHPREDGLGSGLRVHEATLDARLGGAVPHERGVGPATDQQLDRLDDERLARTGLAGDGGEAGPEHEVQVGDDPEIDDVQLDQHRLPTHP